MTENHSPLDLLLLAATQELEEHSRELTALKETDLFNQETNVSRNPFSTETKESLLHSGDTDSSDDEDKRNWEEKKYSDSGREIKTLLEASTKTDVNAYKRSRVSNWKKPLPNNGTTASKPEKISIETTAKHDVYIDPIFGLRIVNPLVSSTSLRGLMKGRESIPFNRLNRFLQIKTNDKDWVIAGVVVHKSAPKTSQKGSQFSVWTLSDLKDDIKTVAVFLFARAHTQLWKTTVGTIVGLLNPAVLEKKDNKDEASLSIDNAQKVIILGQSKDFGTCKSMKKNGDKCSAIVNLSRCEYCVYHIKQEYQKFSVRSELQSSFGGKGLTALRNKVLGKNEVFYAGKSYTAIPAKRSRKLEQKDNSRLNGLNIKPSLQTKTVKPSTSSVKKKSAPRLEVSQAQRLKDLKLLEKLNGTEDLSEKTKFEGKSSSELTVDDARTLALSVLSKLRSKKNPEHNLQDSIPSTAQDDVFSKNDLPSFEKFKDLNNDINKLLESSTPSEDTASSIFGVDKTETRPKLTFSNSLLNIPKLTGFDTGVVDLNSTKLPKRAEKAKLKAIQVIQKKGPITKADPNNIRGTGIKRPIELEGGVTLDNDVKKTKLDNNFLISERFKKIMAASSSHQDLLEARDDEEKEKYFNKLEAKERMEEKMISTHKIACKAVKCFQCKYVSFSASDMCKSEKHILKVFDAFKRFYKCANCKNRTVCLELVPMKPCNNCGSSNWQKTGMMKEKLVTAAHALSIRGGEQTSLNSDIVDANLDLLVPD